MSTYLSDYDYFLPEELIGQKPREPRDSAKLMLIDRKNESVEHKNFYNIIDYLQKGDVLVRNATKVIPARIFGHKDTGGVLEILLTKRISKTPPVSLCPKILAGITLVAFLTRTSPFCK